MSVYQHPLAQNPAGKAGPGDTVHPKTKRVRNREVERAYARAYYARNQERLRANARIRHEQKPIEERRAYQRQWVARDRLLKRERWLWRTAKRRAGERGLEFSIAVEDIVIPQVCPVLRVSMKVEIGKGYQPTAPSLDRIDNRLGYVPGNVRVISMRANRLKCDMTLDEARMLIANWDAR